MDSTASIDPLRGRRRLKLMRFTLRWSLADITLLANVFVGVMAVFMTFTECEEKWGAQKTVMRAIWIAGGILLVWRVFRIFLGSYTVNAPDTTGDRVNWEKKHPVKVCAVRPDLRLIGALLAFPPAFVLLLGISTLQKNMEPKWATTSCIVVFWLLGLGIHLTQTWNKNVRIRGLKKSGRAVANLATALSL